MQTFIIAGLGNPGEKYLYTRHNVGFLALEYYAQTVGVKINKVKFKSLFGECKLPDKRVILIKPQTYMNNSGEAVAEAAKFYKVAPQNIIVISDDITLNVGKIRIREKGSDGGHNGLKSIINHLSSNEFIRMRIGVGQKPHPDYDLVDWVLGELSNEDKHIIFDTFARCKEAIDTILEGDTKLAMSKYNG